MKIHRSISSLRNALKTSSRIVFAPTMGNLHDGHISLMRAARDHGDLVVSSIFVNRLQFGPNEDFDRYPRTFEDDCTKLQSAEVDHLFAPEERELYPQPQSYQIYPATEHESILEGAHRPGHFRGVATVVTKLFNIVQPQVALFGKKDYQQLMVIRNMVREFNMPIEVIGCQTVRGSDGLALSSRNGYLTAEQRQEAPRLYAELARVAGAATDSSDLAALEKEAQDNLRKHGWLPDYVAIRRQQDLRLPETRDDPLVVLAAARLGNTRLIDNIEID